MNQTPTSFKDLVGFAIGFIDILVLLIFALTFLVLVWSIIRTWIIGGAEPAEIEKGKKIITTGVIVLVVMSGIWGIIAFLRMSIFGI